MTRILIVEDNDEINSMLKEILDKSFDTDQAYSGTEAKKMFDAQHYDCVLLDLMLPGMNGEDLLKHIRSKSDVPVIVITAKGDISVLVDVFDLGANDYLAKPFNHLELIARINAQLRKKSEYVNNQMLQVGDIILDEARHEVTIKGKEVILTQKEFALLQIFMSQPGRVFTKANLYELAWKDEYYGDDNTISVHISRLRSKISEHLGKDVIETIWGIGFKFEI